MMQNAGMIIRNSRGKTLGVTLCNEKSRNKTLERGELWVVDPNTGRVLPFAGGGKSIAGIEGREDWYEATLQDDSPASAAAPASTSAAEAPASALAAEAVTVPASETPDSGTSPEMSGPGKVTGNASGSGRDNVERIGTVLTELTGIIAERHRTMPEGSYTTHLFSKGGEKIRKKTGEEAVELILAANRDELTSEAADLIYHLMVLLEAEELTIGDVIDALARRF